MTSPQVTTRQEIFRLAKWFILVTGAVVAFIRSLEAVVPSNDKIAIAKIEKRLDRLEERIEKRLDDIYYFIAEINRERKAGK
jgi:hypothetical protein